MLEKVIQYNISGLGLPCTKDDAPIGTIHIEEESETGKFIHEVKIRLNSGEKKWVPFEGFILGGENFQKDFNRLVKRLVEKHSDKTE